MAFRPGATVRRLVAAAAASRRIDLRIVCSTANIGTVRAVVAAGLGVSIVPAAGRRAVAETPRAAANDTPPRADRYARPQFGPVREPRDGRAHASAVRRATNAAKLIPRLVLSRLGRRGCFGPRLRDEVRRAHERGIGFGARLYERTVLRRAAAANASTSGLRLARRAAPSPRRAAFGRDGARSRRATSQPAGPIITSDI